MKKEYLTLAIILIMLIALNVILDTFPIEGILFVGGIVCIFIYIGNFKTQFTDLKNRVAQLEKYIEDLEKSAI